MLSILSTKYDQGEAYPSLLPMFRKSCSVEDIPWHVCYRDFIPKLGGQYLFRDYETTLRYVKIASDNTSKSEAPLYALWLLNEHIANVIEAISSIAADLGMAGASIGVEDKMPA